MMDCNTGLRLAYNKTRQFDEDNENKRGLEGGSYILPSHKEI